MQIRVLSSNSARAVLDELVPQFAQRSAHALSVSYDPALAMLRRIDAGESADVALLGDAAIDRLIGQGRILADSRHALARMGIGVGVRAGAPHPRIDSVAAFKRALLDAASIAHTREGASGIHFGTLIERLGIAAEVRAKARTQPGGLVGELVIAGEAQLAIQQIPELLAVPGIELVGPLPAELQQTGTSVAGVFSDSRHPEIARSLVAFLASPDAARVFVARGFEPAL